MHKTEKPPNAEPHGIPEALYGTVRFNFVLFEVMRVHPVIGAASIYGCVHLFIDAAAFYRFKCIYLWIHVHLFIDAVSVYICMHTHL